MKKQSSWKDSIWWILLIAVGVSFLLVLCYLIYRIGASNRSLISITMLPVLAGLIYENRRLGSSWGKIGLKSLGAFFLSFLAFIPFKREYDYLLDDHLEAWPFWFFGCMVLISMVAHEKKLIPKLTEGITLIQSIAIIYWLIDIKALSLASPSSIALMIIGLPFVLFSLLHAFTYARLTRSTRLTLSLWSSVIMLVFAGDHIIRVFMLKSLEYYDLFDQIVVIIQYFILGIALMYVVQNLLMLLVYLPGKTQFYNKKHRKEIRETNKQRIKQFSSQQIPIFDSVIALVLVSGAFYLNYHYQIFPRNTAIWLMFMMLPMVIRIKQMLFVRRSR